MKTKVMSVTPEVARRWLKENSQNRNVRQSHVDFLASEMLNGRWVTTHQGVCIAEDGVLLDGQHRLLAVAQSGVTVDIMVTTGSDKSVMPVTDQGMVTRSVGDTLYLLDGVKDASIKTAACRTIVSMCGYFQNYKISVGLARIVIDEFGNEIDFTLDAVRVFKPAKVGWIIGTLSFCLHADKDCAEFIQKFGAGANLSRKDAALSLRDWLVNKGNVNLQKTFKKGAIECICNAALNGARVNPLTQIKSGSNGLDYFTGKNRGFVEQMRGQVAHQIESKKNVTNKSKKEKRNDRANLN